MTRWHVSIAVGYVEADDEQQAKSKARELLEELSESNDGSEVLANAKPVLRPVS